MHRRHALQRLLAAAAPLPWLPGAFGASPTGSGPYAAVDAEGWRLPTELPQLEFPRDHFLHADFRNEWWYLTGHLRSAEAQRDFGLQLTFFRVGLRAPGQPAPRSAFLPADQPLAHFAISDPTHHQLHAVQRFERAAFGRAGFGRAGTDRPHADSPPNSPNDSQALVWLDDWSLSLSPNGFRAQAENAEQAVKLELTPSRAQHAIVLQGEQGLSRKTLGNQHNSCYYSIPRLDAVGSLRLGQEQFSVNGQLWLDREWSSRSLDANMSGWDWFSLQLADGRDLMLFQLRDRNQQRLPGGHGTLVDSDGRSRNLTAPEFQLLPLQWWTHPQDGTRYPTLWKVEVPNEGLQLVVAAAFENQEIRLDPIRYWEGMVEVRGQAPGRGYLEMTGYAAADGTLDALR